MQSNNPIFRRSEDFQRGGANMYGNQTYAGNGAAYPGYGQPQQGYGTACRQPDGSWKIMRYLAYSQ